MRHLLDLALVVGPLGVLAVCARRLASRASRRPQAGFEHDLRAMIHEAGGAAEDEPVERERIR